MFRLRSHFKMQVVFFLVSIFLPLIYILFPTHDNQACFEKTQEESKDKSFTLIGAPAPRSGTNFLFRLLLSQNAFWVCPSWDVTEFPFVRSINSLESVVSAILQARHPDDVYVGHIAGARMASRIRESLGRALVSQQKERASETSSGQVLAHTPDHNTFSLASFRDYFPRPTNHVIFVVRDGRDTVDSMHRAFHIPIRLAAIKWNVGALLVAKKHRSDAFGSFLIKYEDLVASPITGVLRVFSFIGLNRESIDREAALAASRISYGATDALAKGHYDYGKRSKQASEHHHWTEWSQQELSTFWQEAGDGMRALAYEAETSRMANATNW